LFVEVMGLEPISCSPYLLGTTRLGQHFLMFRNDMFFTPHISGR